MELFSRADRGDDVALLAGLALGDDAAATAFVRRFQARVYGLALAITRDPALAQDVGQEVFVRVWRSAASYDARRATVLTWLLSITRNAAIDAVRLRRPTPVEDETLERFVDASLLDDTTAHAAIRSDERARAVARLRELPPEQARAVVLAVIAGCTAGEIGEREQIPLGTAKTRIRTGLRRLRVALADESEEESRA